jgi:hypothetical protein
LPRIARIDEPLEASPLGRDAGPIEHRGSLALERNEGSLQGCGSAMPVVVYNVCT